MRGSAAADLAQGSTTIAADPTLSLIKGSEPCRRSRAAA
jgi:hypothetical protein